MAKLRAITKEMLTSDTADITELEVKVKENHQRKVAIDMLKYNSDIVYFNYWDDCGNLSSFSREDCLTNNK